MGDVPTCWRLSSGCRRTCNAAAFAVRPQRRRRSRQLSTSSSSSVARWALPLARWSRSCGANGGEISRTSRRARPARGSFGETSRKNTFHYSRFLCYSHFTGLHFDFTDLSRTQAHTAPHHALLACLFRLFVYSGPFLRSSNRIQDRSRTDK